MFLLTLTSVRDRFSWLAPISGFKALKAVSASSRGGNSKASSSRNSSFKRDTLHAKRGPQFGFAPPKRDRLPLFRRSEFGLAANEFRVKQPAKSEEHTSQLH